MLVGLVGIVVAAALDRRGLGSWDLDADFDRLTAGSAVVLVAAGLLSLASSRRTRVVAVVLAVAAGTASATAAVRAVTTGLPGPSTGVLAATSAVVLVGVVARVFGGGADPARTSAGWRRVLPVLLATAVTALGGVAAAAAVVDAPVRGSGSWWQATTGSRPWTGRPGRRAGRSGVSVPG